MSLEDGLATMYLVLQGTSAPMRISPKRQMVTSVKTTDVPKVQH